MFPQNHDVASLLAENKALRAQLDRASRQRAKFKQKYLAYKTAQTGGGSNHVQRTVQPLMLSFQETFLKYLHAP
jgi:hypothetical protein